VLDKNLRIVSVNRSFCTAFKVAEKETVGRLLPDLSNRQWNIPELIHLLKKILPKKTVVTNYEVEHEFKTIGQRIMNLNARKLRIPKKEDLILLAIEDVTERKIMAQKLAEAESLAEEKAKDEAIFDTIGDHAVGLVVVNKDGKIMRVNKGFETLTAWKEKEVIGKSLIKVLPREDENRNRVTFEKRILSKILSGKILATVATAAAGGIEKIDIFYYIRKDKSRFPANSVISPILFNGKITGAVEVFYDITEEKELERIRMDFLSLASHQLRTPLIGVQWVAERFLKKEKQLSKKGKEYLKDINASCQRLSDLVDRLLNVSRIETGEVSISPRQLDLVEFTERLLDEYSPLYAKKRITLIFKKHPKIVKVVTDDNALRNIMQTIISNTIEYTKEGGRVEVSLKKKNRSFLFTVQDTGIGIPEKDQATIFNKFARGSNAKLIKTDGIGIGLYFAKKTINLLRGKIWFKSKEDKGLPAGRHGTTFYVRLPLKLKSKKGSKNLI